MVLVVKIEGVWDYLDVELVVCGFYLLGVEFFVVDLLFVMLMCWLCNMFCLVS